MADTQNEDFVNCSWMMGSLVQTVREKDATTEMRIEDARLENNKTRAQFFRQQSEAARADRIQVAKDVRMNMEYFFRETKSFLSQETLNMKNKVAQTVLDIEGLHTRMRKIYLYLKATLEVKMAALEYLEKSTHDYSAPDGLEFKIRTPNVAPKKS